MVVNQQEPIRAVFDLDNDSLKMVVLRYTDKGIKNYLDIERVTALGAGVSKTGKISETAIPKTISMISDLMEEAREFGAEVFHAIGTDIFRTSFNAQDLVEPLLNKLDLRLRILTPEEAAVAGFIAVRKEIPDNPLAVLDIGDGAIDLALGEKRVPEQWQSLPLGASRINELFPLSKKMKPDELRKINDYIHDSTQELKIPANYSDLFLIGGIARSLAGYAKVLMGAPGNIVADSLYIETIQNLIRLFTDLTLDEIRELPGTHPDKAETARYGAIILHALMEVLEIKQARISLAELQFGYILAEMDGIPLALTHPKINLPHLDFRPFNRKNRCGEVVFILRRPDGKVWLHTKEGYPENVYRLPGGGVKIGEKVRDAALREIAEETSFKNIIPVPLDNLTFGVENQDESHFFTSLFLADVDNTQPVNQDKDEKITGWFAADLTEMEQWANKLSKLKGSYFAWGKFRAAALFRTIELARRDGW